MRIANVYASRDARYTIYMHMIADFLRSRKGRDVILVTAMCLLATLSFGLGRLSVHGGGAAPVTLVIPKEVATTSVARIMGTPVGQDAVQDDLPAQSTQAGAYVASKTGAVYHLPWCSGAKRIKEENKIWFASKEEAEQAGYRPAANCKGI